MRVAVRVKAGAKRDGVGGRWDGALGEALVVSVRAPAVDGKANTAVCRVLAAAFGLRARDVTVVRGQRSRDKLVEFPDVEGVAERVAELLESRVEAHGPG
ncbi:DUF167 domain-containing protein [Saccharomonospora glauca]|jgi:uncharacterized protein (TIGR00251 family)|uniref:UPF0235 protein SacglDRAFT_03099 n=1 Tax=Saccharomonospora glauca K62 TaxID=928724 RepID=I1D4U1_9PSEU|nr:DUF167 domain-containing protein [Saccharomonospora glauca]EIE99965.1 hypothetical protein SacglDRAFT_03099 [Saccharomonospora glauca K62]